MGETLLELAEARFGALKQSEKIFFSCVEKGQPVDFRKQVPEQDNPAQAGQWQSGRVLRADRIVWLCRDSVASSTISGFGIQIMGARIDGDIDLQCLSIPHPVALKNCALSGNVNLTGSDIQLLDLSGSHVCSIDCAAATVNEGIFFRDDFRASGLVRLEYLKTKGRLDCSGGQFINPGCDAIDADGIEVRGDTLLNDGFRADGMVSFVGAKIGGNLECNQGVFKNTGDVALNAERLQVGGDVFFCQGSWRKSPAVNADGFAADGEVKLGRAEIRGTIECGAGLFDNSGSKRPAINAEGIIVSGHVLLHDGFRAKGKVDLRGATIQGNLECNEGMFKCCEGTVALDAERAKVSGDVFLCKESWCGGERVNAEGFKAVGEVKFVRAFIGGDLNCIGGDFRYSAETCSMVDKAGLCSINAKGLRITGSVLLGEGFTSMGKVDLVGAVVDGNLEFNSGQFLNWGRVAIDAERVRVAGDIFLCGGYWHNSRAIQDGHFQIEGNINLISAEVGGTVKFDGASFASSSDSSTSNVSLLGARIKRELVWESIGVPEHAVLDLRMARVGRLHFSADSWPTPGNLRLDGLVYDQLSPGDSLSSNMPEDQKERKVFAGIKWLRRQGNQFHHQPYQQLVAFLHNNGRGEDAKAVLVAKADDRARLTEMTVSERCWHRFLGMMIGYGYRPWRALIISIVVIAVGALFFGVGYEIGIIKQTKLVEQVVDEDVASSRKLDVRGDYPKFNWFVYSLDMFVPLVDLRQAAYWLPSAVDSDETPAPPMFTIAAMALRFYMWLHILAGWVLSSLLVVGLGGLVKR